MGRLGPGVSASEAGAEVTTIATRLQQEFPDGPSRSFTVVPSSLWRILPGADPWVYSMSLVAVGLVILALLVASANIANMLLARGISRQREIAIRLSLGATRGTVVRQVLTEGLLLSLLGATVGLAVAVGSNQVFNTIRLPLPVDLALGVSLDGRVVAFTFVISVLTALASSVSPALMASRTHLVSELHDRTAGITNSLRPRRWHNAAVVVQVAVSLVLLICAGLAVRSVQNANRIDPGFEPSSVAVATFAPGLQGHTPAESEAFYRRLAVEIRQVSGITSAWLCQSRSTFAGVSL